MIHDLSAILDTTLNVCIIAKNTAILFLLLQNFKPWLLLSKMLQLLLLKVIFITNHMTLLLKGLVLELINATATSNY